MYSSDRRRMRQPFIDAWEKGKARKPLAPIEQMIFDVIRDHPEYHSLLDQPEFALEADWPPEMGVTNPFLHMSMHLSLREMVQTDRPAGIRSVHSELSLKKADPLEAEHEMIDCLGEALWQAQQNGQPPDEAALMTCLKDKLKR
ncbi:MAG: DUF1841 family protein [Guyparkeria sp.]|uniref:DUF1841 family protein n=1 Tax=Guyparkeria sp. TaxID=2035736 RepID=UPI00397B2A93